MKITDEQYRYVAEFLAIAREYVAPGIDRFDIALTKARAALEMPGGQNDAVVFIRLEENP